MDKSSKMIRTIVEIAIFADTETANTETDMANPYKEVENIAELPAPDSTGFITRYVFQYIDFNKAPQYVAARHRFSDCFFFGCEIPKELEDGIGTSCLVFPRMGMPYNVFRSKLYTAEYLYDGYDPENEDSFANCFDSKVFADYIEKGKESDNIRETLGRSLHDHAIGEAMNDFLSRFDERQVVAVMGGHALKRTDDAYATIAYISKRLTESGKLMASGGGPGAMEATHLGAWMAGRTADELQEAFSIMSVAPSYNDSLWLPTAWQVRSRFPNLGFESLGIPTWLYGHEPSTPLATHIAKFFDNSIREDSILTLASGGIIYTPGSAGTLQEIFQEAVQNHYLTFGYASPMIFMGKQFWTERVPVWPLLMSLIEGGVYKNLILCLTDEVDEAERVLMENVK